MSHSNAVQPLVRIAGATILIAVGVVIGATISPTRAQPASAVVWEATCVEPSGVNSVANVNESLRTLGAAGWEPYGFYGAAADMPCFKRRR